MDENMGALSGSREPSPSSTGLGPSGFDPERERAAFIAGWLLLHSRPEVDPNEGWLEYLEIRARQERRLIVEEREAGGQK